MDFLKKYFYGLLSPEEESQVQYWLADHMEEPQVQEMLLEIMSEMEKEDEELLSKGFAEMSRKLGFDRKGRTAGRVRPVVKFFVSAAACLLLMVAGATAYRFLAPSQETEWLEKKVPFGQTEEMLLSDGTRIRLNSGSRITYPSEFRGKERRIFVDGEIFAEVSKDPKHPFYVNSGDVDVKVLGTKFNFKAFDDAECVELLLFEGSVQVDVESGTKTKQVVLSPGEMLQFDRTSGKIDYKDFNPQIYKGFYDDRAIHFFNLSLEDIAGDLERLFGTRIVILDESLAHSRYFAWFTNDENLDQILNSLNVNRKMEITRKDGVVYIAGR